MKNYLNFTTSDFIKDDVFQSWILNPTEDINTFWNKFLSDHPEKSSEIKEAKKFLQALKFKKQEISDSKIEQIKANIDREISHKKEFKIEKLEKENYFYYKIAASILGFILFTALIVYRFAGTINEVKYQTAYGEVLKITLPDSSQVILNSNSTLTYSNNWEESTIREVHLKGEAFFKVKHLNRKKFIVRANKVNVEVLGTTFNVNNRRGKIAVILNSGKVKLGLKKPVNNKNEMYMKPGDLVEVTENDKVKIKNINPEVATSWIHEKYIFNKTSLKEIAQLVEDNYGLEVTFEDPSIGEELISGEISSKNVDLVLKSLAKSLDIEVEKNDDDVVFKR